MSWTVYIVECSDSSFYTGIAKNVKDRIDKHNSGKGAKYTRSRLPVKLVYKEPKSCRSSASKREYQIKQLTKQQKLDLINTK